MRSLLGGSRSRLIVLTGLWLLAGCVLAVQLIRVRTFWYYGMDIEATWVGSRNLWTHGNPYLIERSHSPFVYPPSAALLFSPFALLENRVFVAGGLALTVVSAFALSSALAVLLRARWYGRTAAGIFVITVLSSVGTETLGYANLSWLIAALAGWTLVAANAGRWSVAAILVGLAVALKPMAVSLGLVFLARRRFRSLALAAGIPLVLNLASLPLLAAPAEFVTTVLPNVLRGATTGVWSNPSLWAAGQRHSVASGMVDVARIATVALGAFAVIRAFRRPGHAQLAIVGLGATAAIMLTVQVNQPSYGLVLLPLAATLFAHGGAMTRVISALSAGVILTCGTPGWLPTDFTTFAEIALLVVASLFVEAVPAPAGNESGRRTVIREPSGAAGRASGPRRRHD